MFGPGRCPSDLASRPSGVDSRNTTPINSSKEMNDIMKIIKSLEESSLLIKGISEAIRNEAKEQRGGFLGMLLSTVCARLLGNLLTVKKVTIY